MNNCLEHCLGGTQVRPQLGADGDTQTPHMRVGKKKNKADFPC